MAAKTTMVRCTTRVNRADIRRESINGVEHIVMRSFTLPADIVMNGGLYPQSERDSSFQTLEKTLAPIEHPIDSSGNFIPATDPEAIHNFHAGAFNRNVELDAASNRVKIDKFINVQEANKTDRGKRLLDRIEEIETNEKARPIHTSVCCFLTMEELEEPQVNAHGKKFTWIARDMVFDHDAILLDSVGAAQPSQGVGIGINSEGEEIESKEFILDSDEFESKATDNRTLVENQMSFSQIERQLFQKINPNGFDGDNPKWVEDVFDDHFIFNEKGVLMQQNYSISNDEVQVMDFPLVVEREVSYVPKTNSQEGTVMKDLIINALKDAGIETEGLDDDTLFAKYNELKASEAESDPGDGDETPLADVVTNAVTEAVKPLNEKIDGLEAKINESSDAEKDQLIETIVNSKKYPNMTKEILAKLNVDEIKSMAANCGTGHGIRASGGDAGGDEKAFKPLALVGATEE